MEKMSAKLNFGVDWSCGVYLRVMTVTNDEEDI